MTQRRWRHRWPLAKRSRGFSTNRLAGPLALKPTVVICSVLLLQRRPSKAGKGKVTHIKWGEFLRLWDGAYQRHHSLSVQFLIHVTQRLRQESVHRAQTLPLLGRRGRALSAGSQARKNASELQTVLGPSGRVVYETVKQDKGPSRRAMRKSGRSFEFHPEKAEGGVTSRPPSGE